MTRGGSRLYRLRRARPVETSKVVLAGTLLATGLWMGVVLIGWLCGLDGAPEMAIAPASLAGISLTAYSAKAALENRIKLAALYGREAVDWARNGEE